MMKILFAASEAVPFMKTGGLADVTGSLPGYFDKKHFDVRIIMPKYLCMDEKWKAQLRFVCHFYVNLSWRRQYVGIFETVQNGITYYFVDNEFYFAGDKPYHNIYEDVEKFAFFSKAVLEALPYLDFWPDVIHCHDWQTGLVPVFLRTFYGDQRCYSNIRTVFSVHNLKFQGRFSLPAVIDITGLPEQIFSSDKLESYGEANYLKGGVVYADAVTTVSPTYAREIMTPEGGEGLDGLMRAREGSLYGILNGIDIVVGGSIIIPMDIRVEDTTISITMNGRYIKNPMINAILNSLIINAGISISVGISSSEAIEPASNPLIFKNVSKSLFEVCFSINVRSGLIPVS